MDIIDLPILPIATPLNDAMAAMRLANRSGVVAIEEGGNSPGPENYRCWLYKAGWVAVGISRGEHILADLEHRRRVHILNAGLASTHGIDLTNLHYTGQAVEQMLDSARQIVCTCGTGAAFWEYREYHYET